MKQPPRQRPFKDERDEQIETNAKSYALEWVTAVTQILTIVCIVKVSSRKIKFLSPAQKQRIIIASS